MAWRCQWPVAWAGNDLGLIVSRALETIGPWKRSGQGTIMPRARPPRGRGASVGQATATRPGAQLK